jgi:hypothetical protein
MKALQGVVARAKADTAKRQTARRTPKRGMK